MLMPTKMRRVQLLLAGLLAATTEAAAPTATIDSGVLVGKSTSLPNALGPINQFLGVPFAQSPPERFSPPRAAAKSERPINATEWKSACLQQFKCKGSRQVENSGCRC